MGFARARRWRGTHRRILRPILCSFCSNIIKMMANIIEECSKTKQLRTISWNDDE